LRKERELEIVKRQGEVENNLIKPEEIKRDEEVEVDKRINDGEDRMIGVDIKVVNENKIANYALEPNNINQNVEIIDVSKDQAIKIAHGGDYILSENNKLVDVNGEVNEYHPLN